MQVSHVEKNMVKQSSTVPNEQSGVLKPYPGLDLIDPSLVDVTFHHNSAGQRDKFIAEKTSKVVCIILLGDSLHQVFNFYWK